MLTRSMHRHHKWFFQAEEVYSAEPLHPAPKTKHRLFFLLIMGNVKNTGKIEEETKNRPWSFKSETTVVNILVYIVSFLKITFVCTLPSCQ